MNILNAVLRFSHGTDKHVADGHKAMKQIQLLLMKAIAKCEGAPHALTSEEIAPIRAICDQLNPAHFQLKVPAIDRVDREYHKHVLYQHVYENASFSIGIFILPPGGSIPLHDHPGMSVISRILYGSVVVKSYDLVDSGVSSSDTTQVARLCMDKVLTAPHTMELLPDCGNLHELVGGRDIGCAFLDIITPPYDVKDGRLCTYYRVLGSHQSHGNASEQLVHLEVYDPPDFEVISGTYLGPLL